MLKFGVYDIAQLRNGRDKSLLGRDKKVSISVLPAVLETSEPERSKLYERVMFELNDDRGTYKRTAAKRFEDFDRQAIDFISNRFGSLDRDLVFHDTAVSNGQTAVDFFTQLTATISRVEYLATDYDPYVTLIHAGRLKVAVSSAGEIIEITRPPFVFTPKQPERAIFYPLNYLFRRYLESRTIPPLLKQFFAGSLNPNSVETLTLFSPSALELSRSDKRFRLDRYSLLDRFTDQNCFHCVRAMNVVNEQYFSDAELESLLDNVVRTLVPNGLFIVGSNDDPDSPVRGGIFESSGDKLVPLWTSDHCDFLKNAVENFNNRARNQ